jgi:hypothetical protein
MKRIAFVILVMMLAMALVAAPVLAADYQSGDKVTTPGENTLAWTGQGADITPGELNDVECDESNTGYLLWIFTYDGGEQVFDPGVTPYLVLNDGMGSYYPTMASGNEFHFVTPYYTPDTSSLTAVVHFNTVKTGNGAYILTISHGCPGEEVQPTTQAHLYVDKFYDRNANGVKDPGELFLDGWLFTIGDDEYGTPFDDMVDPGTYLITELVPCEPNWVASGISVENTEDYTIISTTQVEVTLAEDDDVTVLFGNYCLVPSGGLTLGFWSNKNGQKLVGSAGLTFLCGLNLVNGGPFNPTCYAQFRTWLLAATATNMAYMLSAQLAAMELNVWNGVVDGNAFYIPYGGTINQLMAEANAELLTHPTAYSGNTWRGYQETLKNYLDALNNGALVIPSEHCPYSFSCYG